jgi:hypothetical protein
MRSRHVPALVTLVVSVALLPGCGSDDSESSSGTTTTATPEDA